MSASTPPTQQSAAAGGPPVPPVKPILSSPGAYMANFQPASGGAPVATATPPTITAGIHGTNKTHEKPTIAARPIPPPKLPNYSSSFNKIDRDRNEFTKMDKAEREKLATKREMFFKSESNSPSGPPPNPPVAGLNNLNLANNNVIHNNNASHLNNASNAAGNEKHNSGSAVSGGGGGGINNSSQGTTTTNTSSSSSSSIGAMVSNHSTTNNNHSSLNGAAVTNGGGGGVNGLATSMNSISLKEKRDALLNHHVDGSANGLGHHHHPETGKLAVERHEKEKPMVKSKPKELDGYVGFANLPNQVYRKAVKKGFELTLMVVGESGLGKSTLINSMFLSDIYHTEQHPGPSQRIKKTVAVESTKVLMKENGVNLTLTVVDTPGFGDAVDNSNCWIPIVDFVESKYEEYLTAESRVHRIAIPDTRVHVCLYFIAPSGHGLKPLDIEFMQRLCDKVNIIPVVAKADTLTPEEITLFKKQILNEIAQNKIKIYDFPDPLDEEEDAKVLRQLRSRVPFAVVGANAIIEIDGRKVRGRRYPWGIAEVENLEHCDFIALRNMVIRTNLQDLKDVTNNVHYENYRCRKLAGLGSDGKTKLSNNLCNIGSANTNGTTGWNPLAQMEEEKREHESKMKKMEAEMEQVFEMKVKEKKQKLKDSEAELTRRHEERKKALELQIRELDDRRKAFEHEKADWEQQNGVTLDELRRKSLEANSKETASLASRSSDESKGRRVFGSLLRRHTSFGAPDTTVRAAGVVGATGSTATLNSALNSNNNSTAVTPSPQDHNNES